MKTFLKITVAIIIFITIFKVTGISLKKEPKDNNRDQVSVSFEMDPIEEKAKEKGKEIINENKGKVADFIYDKATKYNPEGDVLPDQYDDIIKDKINQKLNNNLNDEEDK